MTARLRTPMHQPLRGIKIHRAPEVAHQPSPRAVWLMSLREAQVRETRRQAELSATLDGLREQAARLPAVVDHKLGAVAALATEIGLTVAREVVGQAVQQGVIDPAPAVRRCLEEASVGLTGTKLEIRLHPEDLSLVMTELEGDPLLRDKVECATFVPDPGLSRAAVRIDTESGRLKYECGEVLDRISQEVRGSLAEVDWGALTTPSSVPDASDDA